MNKNIEDKATLSLCIEQLRTTETELRDKLQRLDEARLEQEIYKTLENITKEDGSLTFHLLQEQLLPKLEETVNLILGNFLQRTVKIGAYITCGTQKNTICIKFDFYDANGNPTSMLGGMESFVHDMVLRLALGQLACVPRSNLLIIDEKMSVMDKDQVASLGSFMDFFRQVYQHIIVISHTDGVTDVADTHMTITRDGEGLSHLCVG